MIYGVIFVTLCRKWWIRRSHSWGRWWSGQWQESQERKNKLQQKEDSIGLETACSSSHPRAPEQRLHTLPASRLLLQAQIPQAARCCWFLLGCSSTWYSSHWSLDHKIWKHINDHKACFKKQTFLNFTHRLRIHLLTIAFTMESSSLSKSIFSSIWRIWVDGWAFEKCVTLLCSPCAHQEQKSKGQS